MTVEFLPSQIGTESGVPLPYTSSPLRLLWSDVVLFFRSLWAFPGIFLPLKSSGSGELTELHPSAANSKVMAIHAFLCIYQIAFLLSLPFCVVLPLVWVIVYVAVVLGVNYAFSRILNGTERFLESRVAVSPRPEHDSEHWIFINGVAVGKSSLQSSVDRLSHTFGRRVTGVHNPTAGMIFDVLQCLIQRNFTYATEDVRDAYVLVKEALLNPKYKTVVLIVHSQGGIEGGLIIDWLLDEIPHDTLRKLEVYTFGNAANHYNNPHRHASELETAKASGGSGPDGKSIGYIEHYANSDDFVSVWGVLNFIRIPNRYMGRLFVRPGPGHMLDQHYLGTMFTLGPDKRVLETNEFMEMEVEFPKPRVGALGEQREDISVSIRCSSGEEPSVIDTNSPVSVVDGRAQEMRNGVLPKALKVKDFSRLWLYRNGGSPGMRH